MEPDDLQFGFTKCRSGIFAAFILNECVSDSIDHKKNLFVASLDVVKAFDVLRHESLLDKQYERGMGGHWWKMKEAIYRSMTTRVIWEGKLSNPIKMMQGIRQGAYPSPADYKHTELTI